IPVRNGIVSVKSPEMIYPDHIVKLVASFQSPDPPGKPCLFMVFPVIKRISPKLSGSCKGIRRAAGHSRRSTLLIKLEKLRICPGIGAVKGYINRDISDNADSLIV